MMENEGYSALVGNGSAPYLNSLAGSYLKATNSYARGHYSLPNYLEMISGNAFEKSGTSSDCSPSSCGPISGKNLADQLQAAGIGWKAYMGSMASDCSTSNAGGSGGYGVRHDPFVYFAQGRRKPECKNIVPSGGMLKDLSGARPPAFVFYSPSICNDGGYDASCSTIANGDSFLSKRIPQIMGTSWYRAGGTIILTWDEGSGSDNSGKFGDNGGHVLTVVISAKTKGAGAFTSYLDTAGILRTVEHAYGLSYLADAARSSSPMLPLGK
ncbi:MAG TPA: alkaline phosphatase family protein [Acidimicrobiales bacterium]|nr:alkaline phosphatase family protein [Acidimicrobiales bacterium]